MRLPTGEFARAALLTYLYWYAVYGGYVVTELIAAHWRFVRDAPVDMIAVACVGSAALLLYPLVRFTTGKPIALRLALLVPAGIAVACLQVGINYVENLILGTIGTMPVEQVRDRYARLLLYRLYLELGYVSMLVLLAEARRSADDRVARVLAEVHAERARSAALRFQLNPHFLFNALNAVSGLIVTHRSREAEEMLEKLSDFLRLSLAADPEEPVTLDQELETVEAYLAIEKVRFGARLEAAYACAPELGAVSLPPMLLQPLVENAVKYGVGRASHPVTVTIGAHVEGATLVLDVADDGPDHPAGAVQPGLGVGTQNVQARLRALYGDRARFDSRRHPDGRWHAVIHMPIEPTAMDRRRAAPAAAAIAL